MPNALVDPLDTGGGVETCRQLQQLDSRGLALLAHGAVGSVLQLQYLSLEAVAAVFLHPNRSAIQPMRLLSNRGRGRKVDFE
jgi:hypothetical protein